MKRKDLKGETFLVSSEADVENINFEDMLYEDELQANKKEETSLLKNKKPISHKENIKLNINHKNINGEYFKFSVNKNILKINGLFDNKIINIINQKLFLKHITIANKKITFEKEVELKQFVIKPISKELYKANLIFNILEHN